jgi:hypothetical protein
MSLSPTRAGMTLALALAALALPGAATSSATAADPVLASASGLAIRDIDGGTILAATALASWGSGDDVRQESASTTTPASIANGYVITTSGTRTVAGATGARTTVADATISLRGRETMTVKGLTVGCAPGGHSFTTIDKLLVGAQDLTDQVASAAAGYSFALPSKAGAYDSDAVVTIERSTAISGGQTVTGLRITNGENYEVRDLSLGQVTCASTIAQPAVPAYRAAGVLVSDAAGNRLLDPAPVLVGPGAAEATRDELQAHGYRSRAADVSVASSATGVVTVGVGAFEQLPAEDSLAAFRPSALRVNGFKLTVARDGSSSVTFADAANALFADGRWLNSQNGYIYSKVDGAGDVVLEVKVNERIENPDGTTTVNGLHYIDHTGVWPEVVLGQVTVGADEGGGPGAEEPQPEQPVVPAGTWHAYGIRATGAAAVAATPLITGAADAEENVAEVADGAAAQVSARLAHVLVRSNRAEAEVGTLDLFAGTDAAVHLSGLRTVVTATGATVTTDGGTVFGQEVPAGTVPVGTTFRLGESDTTLVLNSAGTDGTGLGSVTGLRLTSPDLLATTVTAASVTVGRLAADAASTTVRAGAVGSVRYGQQPVVKVTVSGAATGTVRVLKGASVVAAAAVRGGAATALLPRASAVGTQRYVVRFEPTGATAAPSETTVTFTVARARAVVKLVRRSAVGVARPKVAVSLAGVVPVPAGTKVRIIDVRHPKRTLATVRVGSGRAVVKLPRMSRGTHRLRAVVVTSPTLESTTSSSLKVRVSR